MAKLKTKRAAAKRFKKTANGGLKRSEFGEQRSFFPKQR